MHSSKAKPTPIDVGNRHAVYPDTYRRPWGGSEEGRTADGENHFEHFNRCDCSDRDIEFRSKQKFRHNNHRDKME